MADTLTKIEVKAAWNTKPYFHVRKAGDHFKTKGMPTCFLGHELQSHRPVKPTNPFAKWVWDGRRLQAINDQFGIYPVYYFRRENEFGISPSILKLLAEGAPAELDAAGLAVFMRLGFFLGDATPFRSIRALAPNSNLVWEDGELHISGQCALATPERLSREQAIDAYIGLFRAAIQRRLPPNKNFAVPLSGGRDSRHILLELCNAGYRPPYCLTFLHQPPRSNRDVTAAKLLSKRLGLQHVVLDQLASRFQAEIAKNFMTDFCTDEHSQFLVLVDYIKGKSHTIYDGIGGDVLSNGLFLNSERLSLYDHQRYTELAENLFSSFPTPHQGKHEALLSRLLFPKQYQRFNRDIAMNSLTNELRKYAAAPNPVGAFMFWNRTRREIALATYAMLGEVANVLCPYLDHDLYNFLSSLPASMFLDHKFHSETIRRAFPDCADIPFADAVKAPRILTRGYFRQFSRELASYMLGHRPSRVVRSSYLLPRLLRCMLDENYGKSMFSHGWLGPHTVYLLQLERLVDDAVWT
jgi:asparagine synthase (glutamine-hydrolysing)